MSILVLSDVLLLVSQEMTARQKLEIRKMYKQFFIFYSIPKVKHYCLFQENPIYNTNRFELQEKGDITRMVSDTEELVGVLNGQSGSVTKNQNKRMV